MISDYLESLADALRFDRSLSRRVQQEVEDHLWEAVAAHPGSDRPEAEQRAIANFAVSSQLSSPWCRLPSTLGERALPSFW